MDWRADVTSESCVHSSALWYARAGFLAPEQFIYSTYPYDFPGRFSAFTILKVGSENTKAIRFRTAQFTWHLLNCKTTH